MAGPYKPVGADDDELFPPRVEARLAADFEERTAGLDTLKTLSPTSFGTGVLEMASGATLKAALTLVKGDVGLGNVDNVSDANKPVSTAQQAALDAKAPLASPAFTGTPTGITKAHVGLGNVDNTSDAAK